MGPTKIMGSSKSKYAMVLDFVTALYFIVGVFAVIEFVAGKSADILGMSLLIVAVSLFLRKAWSLIALRVIFVLQLVIFLPILIMGFFSKTGTASLLIAGRTFEIPPFLAILVMALYLSAQGYAAFSKQSYVYFEEGK